MTRIDTNEGKGGWRRRFPAVRTGRDGRLHRTLWSVVCCLLSVVLWSSPAQARIVAIHDWASDEGWTSDDLYDTLDQSGGWLELTMVDGVFIPADDGYNVLVETTADNLWAGEWRPDFQIAFDFYAADYEPAAVEVRWGDDASGRQWGATVFNGGTQNMALDTWTHLDSPSFMSAADWGPWSQAEFVADLQSIDWIGVYIERGWDGSVTETYRIDNFALLVPEPSEIALLFAVAMVLGISYRRRRAAFGA